MRLEVTSSNTFSVFLYFGFLFFIFGILVFLCFYLCFSSLKLNAQLVIFTDRKAARPSFCLLTFHISIIFSRTTWPISTKLGTRHPWVKGLSLL